MGNLHFFASMCAPRDSERPPRVFQTRDCLAGFEVLWALAPEGFAAGEVHLNYPPTDAIPQSDLPVGIHRARIGDLVFTTTRPAIHDHEQGARKRLHRGDTKLEDIVIEHWNRYFDILSRPHVRLSREAQTLVNPGFEELKQVELHQFAHGAPCRATNALDGEGWKRCGAAPRTPAFLLRVDQLWENGPGYLGCFGMDGVSTLAWASLLRHDHSHLLRRRGFTMAALHLGPLPERPLDLRWAREWQVEIAIGSPN